MPNYWVTLGKSLPISGPPPPIITCPANCHEDSQPIAGSPTCSSSPAPGLSLPPLIPPDLPASDTAVEAERGF